MAEFIDSIPDLVIETREVQRTRDDFNKRLDQLERESESESDSSLDESEVITTEDLDIEAQAASEILAVINKTFKGIEIAGQIVRNRHATLKKGPLLDLISSGCATGLRFLGYFITLSDEQKNEIIRYIETKLADQPDLTNREIQEYAQTTYMQTTYGVIHGVVRKIASSIGSKEAAEIYKTLESLEGSPVYTLINLAIELQFNRLLNVENVQAALEKLDGNNVCKRILKEIVIQHVYMFPVDYRVKQQLSSILKIKMEGLRAMDLKKQNKI